MFCCHPYSNKVRDRFHQILTVDRIFLLTDGFLRIFFTIFIALFPYMWLLSPSIKNNKHLLELAIVGTLIIGTVNFYYGIAMICNTVLATLLTLKYSKILETEYYLLNALLIPVIWSSRIGYEYAYKMLNGKEWEKMYWLYWLEAALLFYSILLHLPIMENRFKESIFNTTSEQPNKWTRRPNTWRIFKWGLTLIILIPVR